MINLFCKESMIIVFKIDVNRVYVYIYNTTTGYFMRYDYNVCHNYSLRASRLKRTKDTMAESSSSRLGPSRSGKVEI